MSAGRTGRSYAKSVVRGRTISEPPRPDRPRGDGPSPVHRHFASEPTRSIAVVHLTKYSPSAPPLESPRVCGEVDIDRIISTPPPGFATPSTSYSGRVLTPGPSPSPTLPMPARGRQGPRRDRFRDDRRPHRPPEHSRRDVGDPDARSTQQDQRQQMHQSAARPVPSPRASHSMNRSYPPGFERRTPDHGTPEATRRAVEQGDGTFSPAPPEHPGGQRPIQPLYPSLLSLPCDPSPRADLSHPNPEDIIISSVPVEAARGPSIGDIIREHYAQQRPMLVLQSMGPMDRLINFEIAALVKHTRRSFQIHYSYGSDEHPFASVMQVLYRCLGGARYVKIAHVLPGRRLALRDVADFSLTEVNSDKYPTYLLVYLS